MQPQQDRDPSQEMSPRAARRKFLNTKRQNQKSSTARAYEYPTKHFVEYCENHGVQAIGEVDSYLLESWVGQRESEDVRQITVHQNVKLVRVFIKWCQNAGLVEPGLYDRIRVPKVTEEESVSRETVPAYTAEAILEYLSTYEYASRQHAMFKLMWTTAARASGIISLDLDDWGRDRDGDPVLEFVNRRAKGTALKNGRKSERRIFLNEEVNGVLEDYVAGRREDVTDEYGRRPLFTTPKGRLTRQRAYKDIVAFSRPCVYDSDCPEGREVATCEYAQQKKKAMSCPVNTSLHPVRRGSITDHINRGLDKELISERVDVSVEVLEKHYDARTKQEALERRKKYKDLL